MTQSDLSKRTPEEVFTHHVQALGAEARAHIGQQIPRVHHVGRLYVAGQHIEIHLGELHGESVAAFLALPLCSQLWSCAAVVGSKAEPVSGGGLLPTNII